MFVDVKAPEPVVPGDSLTARVAVVNDGPDDADGHVTIDLFASLDGSIDEAEDVLLGSLTQSARIAAGRFKTFNFRETISADVAPGDYRLLARITSDAAVDDNNPANDIITLDEDGAPVAGTVVHRFGQVGDRRNTKFVYTEPDGTIVTLQLSGDGTGDVTFDAQGVPTITLTDTTTRSSLKINPKADRNAGDDGVASVNDIIVVDGASADDGALNQISGKKVDLLGDITVPGAAKKIDLRHATAGSQITVGGDPAGRDTLSLTLDRVENLSIQSTIGINRLTFTDWRNNGDVINQVVTPFIGRMQSKGDRNDPLIDGRFEADLLLNQDDTSTARMTLGNVTLAGPINGTTWDIRDDVGNVKMQDATDWTVNIASELRGLTAGVLNNVNLIVDGGAGNIKVVQWLGGLLDAFSAKNIRVDGDRRSDTPGDANFDIKLSGEDNPRNVVSGVRVKDNVLGGLWSFIGAVGNVQAGATAATWAMNVVGDLRGISTSVGDLAGTVAATTINSVKSKLDLIDATILAGTSLGSDGALGGAGDAADTFGPGSIRTVNVGQNMTRSAVIAGVDPLDGSINDAADSIVGFDENDPEADDASSIRTFNIKIDVDTDSVIGAGLLPRFVRVGTNRVEPGDAGDPLSIDLFLQPQLLSALLPIIQAFLTHDSGVSTSDGVTFDPRISGMIDSPTDVVSFLASFGSSPGVPAIDVLSNLNADGSFAFDTAALEALLGGVLTDGDLTLNLIATNDAGVDSSVVSVTFTLDRVAPTAPQAGLTIATDTGDPGDGFTELADVALTGTGETGSIVELLGTILSTTPDAQGDFTINGVSLFDGLNELILRARDTAGNTNQSTVPVTFGAPPLILRESTDFFVEQSVTVDLGQAAGTRSVSFDIDATFDTSDVSAALEDLLLVYLVDPADRAQTLLDGGEPGEPVFSLADGVASYPAGLVSFDGTTVSIDVTELGALTTGDLVFQLINSDSDTGTTASLSRIVSQVDENGVEPMRLDPQVVRADAGDDTALAGLFATTDLAVLIDRVSYDPTANRFAADLQVTNAGDGVGRRNVVVFADLPAGVDVVNASGVDGFGDPFINLDQSIDDGGLASGDTSMPIRVLIDNPGGVKFNLSPTLMTAGPNQTPQFDPVAPIAMQAGVPTMVELTANDLDGDAVTFSIEVDDDFDLPNVTLIGDGTLIFDPSPDQVGVYNIPIMATDGAGESMQTITFTVEADPITTTRLSGFVLDTNEQPLAGVPVAIGDATATTDDTGAFTIEFSGPTTSDTLVIHGEDEPGPNVYPFIAEKLTLLLDRELYEGAANVVDRPVYLPALDVANGTTINPAQDMTVTTPNIPGVALGVAAGSLQTRDGQPFNGVLSITQVPRDFTPAALPDTAMGDLVLTIQPGDMVFTTPAPLSFPNTDGYSPGDEFNLFSINPETGLFDIVGRNVVSEDGTTIDTVEGGVLNSSWHIIIPDGDDNVIEPHEEGCEDCEEGAPASSQVALYTGALTETHELVTYNSVGVSRGVVLHYESTRADPRPVFRFGVPRTPLDVGPDVFDTVRMYARIELARGNQTYVVPGWDGVFNPEDDPFAPLVNAHFWKLPESLTPEASLRVPARNLRTGVWQYTASTGMTVGPGAPQTNGLETTGDLVVVNQRGSDFGAGWSIAGLQRVVRNPDGSALLIDGNGNELIFRAGEDGEPFISPPDDYSTFETIDGGFRRTLKDQTVYDFSGSGRLQTVTDRNGNQTTYDYNDDGQIEFITDPVGLVTTFGYIDHDEDEDTRMKVGSITDPAGRVTLLEYDGRGDLIKITDPDGSARQFDYDGSHRLTSEFNKRGFSERVFYDIAGRVSGAIQADGARISVNPAQTRAIFPFKQTRRHPFETDPPTAKTIDENPTATYADANGNVTEYVLDARGRYVSALDGEGQLPSVRFDGRGRVAETITGEGHSTFFEYDDRGNIISIRDELSAQTARVANLFDDPAYGVGQFAFTIESVDIDGDLDIDLVVTSDEQLVDVLINNGDGVFGQRVSTMAGDPSTGVSTPVDVAIGDVDEDDTLDLVTANNDGTVSVLLGLGDGSFADQTLIDAQGAPQFQGRTRAVELADTNGDGHLDILVTTHINFGNDGQVRVLPGVGDGTFGAGIVTEVGDQPNRLEVGDLNGDNIIDFATSNVGDGTASVRFGNGDGTFSGGQDFDDGNVSFTGRLGFVTLRDMDLDGDLDLGLYDGDLKPIFLNDGAGNFTQITQGGTFSGNIHYEIADVTGDGILDAIAPVNDRLHLHVGSGNGVFAVTEQQIPNPGAIAAFKPVVADLDGDGDMDIATASGDNQLVVIRFNDGGTFPSAPSPFISFPTSGLELVDVNNDDLPDQVHLEFDQGQNVIAVYPSNGDGTFGGRSAVQPVGPADVTRVADLNEDGRDDVVLGGNVGFPQAGQLQVALSNGDGTFDIGDAIDLANPNLADFKIEDVNGDGDLDAVVLASFSRNEVLVLLGNGEGGLGAPTLAFTSDEPGLAIAVGDVTDDDVPDVVIANQFRRQPDGREAFVFPGNGDGTFGDHFDLSIGGDPSQVEIADLNNDGLNDIVVASDSRDLFNSFRIGQSVSIHFQGIGVNGGFLSRNYQVGVGAVDLEILDIDNDGNPDIATANNDGGTAGASMGRSITVLRSDGIDDFPQRLDYAVGVGAQHLAFGDIDGDGDQDFVTINQAGQQRSVSVRQNKIINADEGPVLPGATLFSYDPVFNVAVSKTDELGRVKRFGLDANGNVISLRHETGGDDVVSTLTYTDDGQIETVTDPLGRVERRTYDAQGRLATTTYAEGTADEAAVSFEYDPATTAGLAGLATAFVDELGRRTAFEYDVMNRLVNFTEPDPDGSGPLTAPVSSFTYDAAGNQVSSTDAADQTATVVRNAAGLIAQITNADNESTRYAYDAAGNITAVIDPLGRRTRYRYDTRNRRVETIDPRGGRETLTLDQDGLLTAITDPVGNVHRFVYDARQRMIREIDADGNVIAAEYDDVDNLIANVDRNGRRVEYGYNELDLRVTEDWIEDGQIVNTVVTSYDAAGNETRLVDAHSAFAFTYDSRNRVATVDNDGTPGAPHVVLTYTRDAAGNRTSTTESIDGAAGATTNYTYDGLNRITQITQSGGGASEKRIDLAYTGANAIATIDRYSDLAGTQAVVSSAFTYDALDRLTQLTHAAGQTVVAEYAFDYDGATGIRQIIDNDGTTDFTYDTARRLIEAEHTPADGGSAREDESYAYDAAGNRVGSHRHGADYVTESGNRLVSDGDFTYAYDNEGQLVLRTHVATGTTRTLEWDHRGRLIAVTDRSGQGTLVQTVTYAYDAIDRRIAKQVDSAGQSQTTYFIYDGLDVALDFTDTGSGPELAMRYVHGPVFDQIIVQETGDGQLRWLLTDHLGTVRDIVDNNGDVLNHLTVDAFGNLLAQTNAEMVTRYLFTGREFDADTGLYYYRSRYYDPLIGRFISEDALFDREASNQYQYTFNEPVLFTDPTGEMPKPLKGTVQDRLRAMRCRSKVRVRPKVDERSNIPKPKPQPRPEPVEDTNGVDDDADTEPDEVRFSIPRELIISVICGIIVTRFAPFLGGSPTGGPLASPAGVPLSMTPIDFGASGPPQVF